MDEDEYEFYDDTRDTNNFRSQFANKFEKTDKKMVQKTLVQLMYCHMLDIIDVS